MPYKLGKKTDRAVPDQRKKLVDEFIALDAEVDAFKHKQFRHSKLRELILDWYPQLAPEEETILAGTYFDILLSSRDKIRSVTMTGKQTLFKKWGQREFISRAVIQLKSLPDPKDELGLYTRQALTGPRHLHVIAKGQVPVKPAVSPAA
jgi:hypothetical protein